MTCEIALMNRQAIALAADSATTVTQWIEGKPQPRYFKGANKIFQLSNYHPVGMMIYGTAALQEVPWEPLVKEFRKSLGDKSFNGLDGYASELFDFVRGHDHLFPQEYQTQVFKDEAEKIAWMYLMAASEDDSVKQAADDAAKSAAFHDFFVKATTALGGTPVPGPFNQADLDAALALHKMDLATQLESTLKNVMPAVMTHVDRPQLAELAIRGILRAPTALMESTGVVIAGFGDHDYFPGFEEYRCHGLLLGKFLSTKIDDTMITIGRPAYIKAFATTAMVRTFQTGYSPDVYTTVRSELEKTLKDFAEKVKAELGATDIPNLDSLVQAAVKGHSDNWTTAARSVHSWPLLRVIGSLPVDEMAGLAETLIMLQSLKEKVTQPTESVGGPVDVAVVSKGDGFIWIKRKHYFEPELNPRFFERQARRDK